MSSKVRDEIIHTFPNFSGWTVEIYVRIRNFIPDFNLSMLGLKLIHVSKRGPAWWFEWEQPQVCHEFCVRIDIYIYIDGISPRVRLRNQRSTPSPLWEVLILQNYMWDNLNHVHISWCHHSSAMTPAKYVYDFLQVSRVSLVLFVSYPDLWLG